jgi:antitoxin component of RelBE/YafQ-DinJ toxin-antitoxin module
MNPTRQISAHISDETRELLERFVDRHGVKKSHLIETAILHHLSALDAIPIDLTIPPIIKVSRETGKEILAKIENPQPPTKAMRALFDD